LSRTFLFTGLGFLAKWLKLCYSYVVRTGYDGVCLSAAAEFCRSRIDGRAKGFARSLSEFRQRTDVFHQTTKDKATVKISAVTEIIVSQTDHVLSVWATVILKYSFTSQKPPSLTCEKINEPAPVATASNSG
jgi:hypothetical protein